jgi:hypothetical protein
MKAAPIWLKKITHSHLSSRIICSVRAVDGVAAAELYIIESLLFGGMHVVR